MATSFPGSLDSFTNPANGQFLNSPNHPAQHANANDAIAALEAKVGANSSAVNTTHDFKLSGVSTADKAVSLTGTEVLTNKTLTTPNLNASGSNTTSPLTVTGSVSNINLNLVPKGTGLVQDNGSNLIDFRSSFFDFISSGGVWSQVSGLNGTMTAMTLWIAGVEYTVATVASHAFTASKDTYIDYTVGSGVTYTEVANNAASPALAANSLRLAIVTTSGAAITNVNQGQETMVLPIASNIAYSVSDSLGNLIYPRDPTRKLLGLRQIVANATTTNTTDTQIAGLTCPVIVPTGRKIKISLKGSSYYTSSATIGNVIKIWEGAVGATQLGVAAGFGSSSGNAAVTNMALEVIRTPAAGSQTYNGSFKAFSAATATIEASSAGPGAIYVELV